MSRVVHALPKTAQSGSGLVTGPEAFTAKTSKLSELNEILAIALETIPRGLSMFDAEQRLVFCNARYREIYDIPVALAQPGTHLAELVQHYLAAQSFQSDGADDDWREWIEHHVSELRQNKSLTRTQHLRNGRIIQVTVQALADGGWVDLQEDVTEETVAHERVTWLSRHCSLTETANRAYFGEQLEALIKQAAEGEVTAVHLVELDHVKAPQDVRGHAADEALTKAFARRIRATLRETDFLGRIEGNKFAIAQTGVTAPEQAERLAQRLVRVLNAPYRVLGTNACVKTSVGTVLAPTHGDTTDGLLEKAEIALYRAKSLGRERHALFEKIDERHIEEQIIIEGDLECALLLDQLELHYQPIINVQTRMVEGVEALMRWQHPKLGAVSPAVFIPIAERTGAIHSLGEWALAQACADALTWTSQCKVTVNISALQLERGELVAQVRHALASSGLPPQRLELEITESVVLTGSERTTAALEEIRSLGVRVALDDFGTAFASLSYLRDFAFDKLKIDRSFIKDRGEDRARSAIVHAVAGLARALEIGAVAEGVETAAQLASVTAAGCGEVQGYLFSAAVPSASIDATIAACEEKLAQLTKQS